MQRLETGDRRQVTTAERDRKENRGAWKFQEVDLTQLAKMLVGRCRSLLSPLSPLITLVRDTHRERLQQRRMGW